MNNRIFSGQLVSGYDDTIGIEDLKPVFPVHSCLNGKMSIGRVRV